MRNESSFKLRKIKIHQITNSSFEQRKEINSNNMLFDRTNKISFGAINCEQFPFK